MKFKVKLRFRNGRFVFAPMVKDYDGKWKYFVNSTSVDQEATTIDIVEFNKKVDEVKLCINEVNQIKKNIENSKKIMLSVLAAISSRTCCRTMDFPQRRMPVMILIIPL